MNSFKIGSVKKKSGTFYRDSLISFADFSWILGTREVLIQFLNTCSRLVQLFQIYITLVYRVKVLFKSKSLKNSVKW